MRTIVVESREEMDRIIQSCTTCFVAVCNDEEPYLLPMNFALDGDAVILHSAQSGRMWEMLKKNPRVSISWVNGEELTWQDKKVGCSYRVKSESVLVEGISGFVTDYDEKVRCLEKIMAQYSALKFKFSRPSVDNVGIIRVSINKISARRFGVKILTPWRTME